jgi:tRNA threonylcarbamoyladenosine biosynthesis protein TsaB
VALYNGAQVISEEVWTSRDYHTVELAPAVAQMMERAGVGVADLRAIAVATGPGSFTGLRIGLALAKGICLARHLPLIGIPTLDIMAAAQPPKQLPLAAAVRAGRGRLAVGWYQATRDGWQSANDIEVLTIQKLSGKITQPTMVCGEFTAEERQLLGRKRVNVILSSPAQSLRRPSYLAELGWRRWQAGQVDDPASLSPNYLQYPESA